MSNEEILGGLRFAINKGESLQKAMTTFYNAGYTRQEIEQAAKMLQQEQVQTPKTPLEKPIGQKLLPIKLPPKKVSAYEEPVKKPKRKAGRWLLIALISVAIIFIGLLIAFLLST